MNVYHHLAVRLSDGSLDLADLLRSSADTPHLSETDAISLLSEAIERSHAVPREGYALAAVVEEAARHIGSTSLLIQSGLALAETLICWERFTEAVEKLDALEQAGPATLVARSRWLRGLALSRMARASEAAQSLAVAGSLLRQTGSQYDVMRWQCDVARVKMLQAEYDQAIALAQASLDYFHSQSNAMPGYAALCKLVMAAAHFSKGDYFAAYEWLARSITGFQATEWLAEQMRAQLIAAQTFSQQYRFSEAITLCEQIHPTLESLDLQASLARCNNTIGLVLLWQGDSLTAVPQFERARDGFMRAGVHAFAADSELNLGHVYFDQGDFQAAIAQYQHALELYRQYGHPKQVAHCKHNVGRCYREMGEYSRSLDYFSEAETAFIELESRLDLAIYSHNRANTLFLTGDRERARTFFERALELYKELQLPLVAAECRAELASIIAAQGDLTLRCPKLIRRVSHALTRAMSLASTL